ncbi:MAG TPA: alkaline phosphatase family protein, partial [Candidatus Aminicenantes bacterium]|nr:alkaline phosphatase family protein [Candidatus Aminicenantes bacterium]
WHCRSSRSGAKKMLVLGFDGMDPTVVRRLIGSGDLPNMKRLADTGTFTMMRSTIPPQSPVAWGSFIAGADPGVTGIFDFLHRDPKTYTPLFAQSTTLPGGWNVDLGKYRIPLKGAEVKLNREGTAFWDVLEEMGVPATVVKIPTNYPPSKSGQRTLAGMGTPDVMGTYGIYHLYTSDEEESRKDLTPNNVFYAYIDEQGVLEGEIEGPKNDLVPGSDPMVIPFKAYVDRAHHSARIDVGGQEVLLAEREYSRWVEISFSLGVPLMNLTGMVKFFLLECGERFRLYISPIHISPASPALPISTPESYSKELADAVGLYHTIGLPADTKALSQGAFAMGDFIDQSLSVFAESRKMFAFELDRFQRQQEGLLFFYFSTLDQGQHMFWALNDPQHPYYHPVEAQRYGGITDDLYRQFDAEVGRAMAALPPEVPLVVMSDHGFAPFRREVNINTWLVKEGYLTMTTPDLDEQVSILDSADWGKSRAYGLGLNGLYLNQRGREGSGIVTAQERRRLLEELKGKLEALTDPQNGARVITHAYISEDVFSRDHLDRAPDIILGFARGYRISDSSPLGQLSPEVVVDHLNWWSGDHLIDPLHVPASFLANFKINRDVPDIKDIAPTIVRHFGGQVPAGMTGKPLR